MQETYLFEQFRSVFPEIEKQFYIPYVRSGSKRHYRYDFRYQNKIIEFHGDFWHAHPLLYAEDFVNPTTKKTAFETWTSDYHKNQYAIDNGYSLLVVWESDFNANRQEVVDRCTNFLLTSTIPPTITDYYDNN